MTAHFLRHGNAARRAQRSKLIGLMTTARIVVPPGRVSMNAMASATTLASGRLSILAELCGGKVKKTAKCGCDTSIGSVKDMELPRGNVISRQEGNK